MDEWRRKNKHVTQIPEEKLNACCVEKKSTERENITIKMGVFLSQQQVAKGF